MQKLSVAKDLRPEPNPRPQLSDIERPYHVLFNPAPSSDGSSSTFIDPSASHYFQNLRNIAATRMFVLLTVITEPNSEERYTMPAAALVSLATSLPPNVFLQKDVLAAAWEEFGPRFPQFETLSSVFTNTGIVKRHGVKPFDWYRERRGWPERTEAFLAGAEALFVDVAQKALASANLVGSDIDTVVTICSTGIATPSLDARVFRRMGFRSDISRVPVFGLGCAGGDRQS
jgi:hypothetical protein